MGRNILRIFSCVALILLGILLISLIMLVVFLLYRLAFADGLDGISHDTRNLMVGALLGFVFSLSAMAIAKLGSVFSHRQNTQIQKQICLICFENRDFIKLEESFTKYYEMMLKMHVTARKKEKILEAFNEIFKLKEKEGGDVIKCKELMEKL